jgi:site-specific recombinase XerD
VANVADATLPNFLSSPQQVLAVNDKLVERFVEYLRVEKGRSLLTIEAYRQDLAQLSKFLSGREFVRARLQDPREYVDHLLSTVTARSAARKMAAIRHFLKFLLIDGLIGTNPMLRAESPKFGKSLPEFLALSEMNAVLNLNTNEHEYLTRRNQAILELLFASALRNRTCQTSGS